MDLPYPTIRNTSIHQEFSHLDKLARSIFLSHREIPKQDSLPKNLKSRILNAISNDNAFKLCTIVEKEIVRFDTEIGTAGSGWNILHFCAKGNSPKCTEYVLKTEFTEVREEYEKLVNSRTVEGYTPIIIAIINRSHEALEKFLFCGGVDIQIIDNHKMSPYEIALNYKNDRAIRLLMSYQTQTKKKQFINEDFLKEPILLPHSSCSKKVISCLLTCVSLGFYNNFQGDAQFDDEKPVGQEKGADHVIEESIIDYVPIGSRKNLPGYDIEWTKAGQLMDGRQNLFESYNPFDIQEKNFTIKNNLILFQTLSNQSWLLRKCIKADQCINHYFNIVLFPKRKAEKVSVDDYIPFIKQRKEAMFLSNSRELWPMLLQKALAKIHKGYFSLAEVRPEELVEEITGFPTFEKDISLMQDQEVFDYLQKLTAKNYFYCLKGRKGSKLSEEENVIDCFNILNFYEKNGQSLVLVNCPFISEEWKKREKDEPLALKLIKGHYNTHNQMCVWINSKQIKDHFSSIIISNTFQNYERTELKIKTKFNLFFKFRVEKALQYGGNHIYMQLHDIDTDFVYPMADLKIFKDQGNQRIGLEESDNLVSENIVGAVLGPGDYMAHLELKDAGSETKQLMLLSWWPEAVQPQCVEEEFGILEWLGFLKTYFKTTKDLFLVKTLGDYSIVLLKEKEKQQVYLRAEIGAELILEGKPFTDRVQLLNEGKLYYCVLRSPITADQVTFDIL